MRLNNRTDAIQFCFKASCKQINGKIIYDLRSADFISHCAMQQILLEKNDQENIGFDVHVMHNRVTEDALRYAMKSVIKVGNQLKQVVTY